MPPAAGGVPFVPVEFASLTVSAIRAFPVRVGTSGLARSEGLSTRPSETQSDVPRRHTASVRVPGPTHSLKCVDQAIWAEELARKLLEIPLPRRWAHVQGVAARARTLAPILGDDADLLEAAGLAA